DRRPPPAPEPRASPRSPCSTRLNTDCDGFVTARDPRSLPAFTEMSRSRHRGVTHDPNPGDITFQEAAMLTKLLLGPAAALVLLCVSAAPALATSQVGRGSLFLDGRVVGTVVPP